MAVLTELEQQTYALRSLLTHRKWVFHLMTCLWCTVCLISVSPGFIMLAAWWSKRRGKKNLWHTQRENQRVFSRCLAHEQSERQTNNSRYSARWDLPLASSGCRPFSGGMAGGWEKKRRWSQRHSCSRSRVELWARNREVEKLLFPPQWQM